MSELEEKLGSILSDPKMMQQIMGMAQMLSGSQQQEEKKPEPPSPAPAAPTVDMGALNALAGIARQGGIDRNQQNLLKALQPFLSRERMIRLERAMSAAKMANAASSFLQSGGLRLLTGR